MLPAGEVVHERYRIRALIGHGGMGAVYRADDLMQDRAVAVKVLTLPPGESQLRFRREFRVMSRMDHPNVVRVIESGSHDELAFLVMEYLRGGTLAERVVGPAEDARELTERLDLLASVADALAYVHGEGIVHRDLKPDNVLLDDGVPYLMDFGLAKTDQQATVALTQVGEVMGTVAYMSPEQARGREVDARSDLYAFGCLVHWAIVGEPPFTGDSFAEILLKQVRDPAQAPSARVRGVPASLDRLVLELLSKTPTDRPSQASDVAVRLRDIVAEIRGDVAGAGDAPHESPANGARRDTTPAQLLNPPLIGRDEEWRRLVGVLDDAALRRGALLEGGTGLGASRLLDDLASEARQAGHAVVRIRNPRGVNLPYHGLRSALTLLRERHPEPFAAATEGLEGDLAIVLPDLFPRATAPNLPADVAQMRVYGAIDRALVHVSQRMPLLVVIDDLHDADDGTVALAHHLASGETASETGLVIGIDPARLASATRSALRHLPLDRIELRPLGDAATRELVRAMLGGQVDEQLERHVADRAAGNPFFVGELLSALLKGGQIVRREGAWEWSREAATLPPSIDDLFAQRIEQLTPRAQATAAAASTVGIRFDFETVQELLGSDEDDLLDDLDELLRGNLIEEGAGDSYRFAHPLLQETLQARLPARRRRRYHQQLADRLEADASAPPDALALHLAEAGLSERAAGYALIAARNAERLFANDVAERYYRLVLDQLPDDDAHDRPDALVALARVLDRIGRWEEAERLLNEALAYPSSQLRALKLLGTHWSKRSELDASERFLRRALELAPGDVDVHRSLGGNLVERGALDEAERVLHEALAIAMTQAAEDPIGLASVQADLGYHAFRSGDWDGALEWYATARAGLPQGDDPLFEARLVHMAGLVHYQRGDLHAARDAFQEAREVYRDSGDVQRVANVLCHLGNVFGDMGDRAEAVRLYQEVLQHAERYDDPKNAAQARYSLAWIHLLHGAYQDALQHVEAATTSLAQQGYQLLAHQARLIEATVLARSGRHAAARAAAQRAAAMLATDDQPYNAALQTMTLGELDLRAGDPDAALARLRESHDRFTALAASEERIESALLMAQAWLARGDRNEAGSVLDEAERLAADQPNDDWRVQVAFVRALLHDDPERLQRAEDDLDASNLTAFATLIRATLQGDAGEPSPDDVEREAP
ncbi:MAG: protein kinase [Trueperaceae bacterium]